MDLMSAAQAAEKLGVSERQVRRLAANGDLASHRLGGRWLLDARAVDERARLAPEAGRPLSPEMAWAVLSAVAAVRHPRASVDPLDFVADRRMRRQLRMHLASAPQRERWGQWLRNRAHACRVWVHPGVLPRLLADNRLHSASESLLSSYGIDALRADHLRCYGSREAISSVVAEYHAEVSNDGQVDLMVLPREARSADLDEPMNVVGSAALVDLLGSPDARERHAAVCALEDAYEQLISASSRVSSQ